ERLDLAAGRRGHERDEVGRHALLADVEGAEAPGRVDLRLARRRDPLLAVDREVELVCAPVLLLPERVELRVVEEAAGRPRAAVPAPAALALLLAGALLALARQLAVIAPLRAFHPAPQQRDGV